MIDCIAGTNLKGICKCPQCTKPTQAEIIIRELAMLAARYKRALEQIEHVTADARSICSGDPDGEDLGMRSAVAAYEIARNA